MPKTLKETILSSFEPIKNDIESLLLYSDAFKRAHLLVVFKDHASLQALESLKNKSLFKHKLVELKLFFYQELVNALDVFPLEFSQIQAKHVLILGRDVFEGLIISNENLRHQCEFYLRSNLLSMREFKLKKTLALKHVIKESLNQFLNILSMSQNLFNLQVQEACSLEELFQAVSDTYQLEVASLIKWIKNPEEIKNSDFDEYESFLTQFISKVDAL